MRDVFRKIVLSFRDVAVYPYSVDASRSTAPIVDDLENEDSEVQTGIYDM